MNKGTKAEMQVGFAVDVPNAVERGEMSVRDFLTAKIAEAIAKSPCSAMKKGRYVFTLKKISPERELRRDWEDNE
jgi:hypothetical protein